MTKEEEPAPERAFRRRRTASLATLIAYAREEAESLKLDAVSDLLLQAERQALAARSGRALAGSRQGRRQADIAVHAGCQVPE